MARYRLTPFRIAAIYSLFGLLALYVSDFYLPGQISDPSLLRQLQAVKGAVEVVLTAGLIYLLTYYGQRQLQQANERLEKYSSIVSHDLRNPLATLEGWMELAETDGDPEAFDRCRQAIQRMQLLIDDLLTLARAGEVVDDLIPVSVIDTFEEAWESVQPDGMDFELEDDIVIQADPPRLKQLFTNLVRNAAQHGGGNVTVRVGAIEDRHGFFVDDDGTGIPPDIRRQVFEPGFTTATDGTGIGLSIVSDISDAHGWEISVTDADTGGARFEITGVDVAGWAGVRSMRLVQSYATILTQ